LRIDEHRESLVIEAGSRLSEPIYSHLNTYTLVLVVGHSRLFLAFSPCPNERVEVFPADYPIGRPARAAYLGADQVFRVIEASSAEKGPFRELAHGPLRRGEPLAVELYDGERRAGRITWLDWSAQVDTGLSPTAGWGLPTNAVEFRLEGDQPDDVAAIYLTLAGTSWGRGWDSVGHGPGTYLNRMRVDGVESHTVPR
jgi:hypothetical protein